MSTVNANGSPSTRGRQPPQFTIHDEGEGKTKVSLSTRQVAAGVKQSITSNDGPAPLTTSKLGNLKIQDGDRNNATQKKLAIDQPFATQDDMLPESMDNLLDKLSEQQALLGKQKKTLSPVNDETQQSNVDSSSSSARPTLGSDDSSNRSQKGKTKKGDVDSIQINRLKKELDDAKDQIARQKHELDQSRVIQHTFTQAMTSSSPSDDHTKHDVPGNHQTARAVGARQNTWSHNEDARSDFSDAMPSGVLKTGQNKWDQDGPIFNPSCFNISYEPFENQLPSWFQPGSSYGWNSKGIVPPIPQLVVTKPESQHRTYSGPASPVSSIDGGLMAEYGQFHSGIGNRRSVTQNARNASIFPQRGNGWDMYTGNVQPLSGPNLGVNPSSTIQPVGLYPTTGQYQPRPIGTPLSPTAEEFRVKQPPVNPWDALLTSSSGHIHLTPMMEPINYRRLLDRNVSCNWKYIVDKIVCNNDQQASLFLQQKLKVGTVEHKYDIIESIVAQAYPLMVNRFGNFLVQRCFEHGTPEQVIAIADSIRGNTLSLSMDAFGCHVVQKAFDSVPEDYKAVMVRELLRRIPETVIHRYACHVWQKLFELRWSDSPPQIMKYVNEALRGMWHEVALGETGSLVVQNIFENCLEEDKRPCLNEVLLNIDLVAHGQFGNWCIQHICEHGLPSDRSRAIDHVLRYATEYSVDQYASKVVEKCLKVAGPEFLDRYLERVCEGQADRPRIPLVDIASDQYGNYLIQYILTHANPTHREIVASHIRKHMVSLRGSKFGSRVGMLCCNPAYATHPGPGLGGLTAGRYSTQHANNASRYSGAYR